MKTIWINAGELSGDMQAAALLTALREREPELAAIGMGGPNLARAGQKNLFRVESLSVMGIDPDAYVRVIDRGRGSRAAGRGPWERRGRRPRRKPCGR